MDMYGQLYWRLLYIKERYLKSEEDILVITVTIMDIRSCILLACALTVSFSQTEGGKIQKAVDTCAVEYDLPADEYNNFVFYNLNMKLDDCVAACAMRKLGTMSKDGVFTGEEIKKLIATAEPSRVMGEELNAVIDKCVGKYGKGGNDSCETVKNLRNCYENILRETLDNDWSVNGSINQALLFTVENFADAYPNGINFKI